MKDRRLALLFRAGALLFALAGLAKQLGIFGGKTYFSIFMYYTIQSNLLAVVLFALLILRMARDQKGGVSEPPQWTSRFGMVCMVDLLVTLVVFWVLLVPTVDASYLFTFENIAVHTVTPLLCLVDYFLFARKGCLKYVDALYVCIFPLGYVLFTSIAGLMGYVYSYEQHQDTMELVPVRFPYFFLDFDRIGIIAALYIAGILLFFLLLSHIFYFIDRKGRKRPEKS